MLQIVEGICNAHGVNGSVKYETTCPVTFNSKTKLSLPQKLQFHYLEAISVMVILNRVYSLKIFLLWQTKNLAALF